MPAATGPNKPYGVVYLLTNLLDGKYYVGQTTTPLSQRMAIHRYDAKCRRFWGAVVRAVHVYGFENFTHSVLAEAQSQEDLNALERLWVVLLDSQNPTAGYNEREGGRQGALSPAAIALVRAANLGRKASLETRSRMSASRAGIERTQEHCANIGRSVKGKAKSTEHRARLSVAAKARCTPEWRAKRSDAQKLINKNRSRTANGRFG